MWVPESPEWQRRKARAPAVPLRALLSPEMLRRIIGGSVVMALGFGVYYGLQALYPMMLADEQGLGTTGVGTMLILFNVGMLIGTIACGVLAARRGVTTAVVIPALLMVPLLPLYIGSVDGLLPVGAFLGGAIGVGFCGVVPMMLTNLFDPAVRARCVGLVYHAGAFAGAFVPMLIAALHEQAGLSLAAAIGIVAASFEILLAAAFLASRRSTATAGAPAAAHL
jgi:SHS family lactate transporter-like MFS transporter